MASMSEPLLSIRNHHAPACGDPPIVNSDDPNVYIGYFENEHGEQWIFTCDRTTRRVELRGGDAGWTKTYAVTQAGVNERLQTRLATHFTTLFSEEGKLCFAVGLPSLRRLV
jgi:hypothetical protein